MYAVQSYGYSDLLDGVRQLSGRYPFLSAHVIGESVMGKPLLALRCGTGSRRVHMNGSFHANEWITSALLMRFVADLSAAYCTGEEIGGQQAADLCREVTLWVVPMVNPDGVELSQQGLHETHPYYRQLVDWNGGSAQFSGWKANIRGVDLNDQFPAFWEEECKRRGMEGPAPRDYPGPYPLSEPEAAAMARFTDTIDFHRVMALHTQGREIYWNYRDFEPAESEQLASKLARVSGYEAVKLTGSDAGYKDWYIQRYRRPGFTVEAGYGENPLPMSKFDSIYVELQPLLLEMLRL
ncbi:M14 family metallopeptidase [Paenibacillus sinopodophylli]|uniref:M14 family metallopeptidase n=1 Tax=Paenibacillus sinopodophylli TaxID=1837342 RepID=UPI00110C8E63|nr:M14 family metallocarboxypeptidase [Paenibacillus sinopodophylli]